LDTGLSFEKTKKTPLHLLYSTRYVSRWKIIAWFFETSFASGILAAESRV
jgi:hypothetical protein